MTAALWFGIVLGALVLANVGVYLAERRIREARAAVAEAYDVLAARPRVVMPEFEMNDHMQIVGMRFDLGTFAAGETVSLMIPRIPGFGRQMLVLRAENMPAQFHVLDFESGMVRPATDEETAAQFQGGINTN